MGDDDGTDASTFFATTSHHEDVHAHAHMANLKATKSTTTQTQLEAADFKVATAAALVAAPEAVPVQPILDTLSSQLQSVSIAASGESEPYAEVQRSLSEVRTGSDYRSILETLEETELESTTHWVDTARRRLGKFNAPRSSKDPGSWNSGREHTGNAPGRSGTPSSSRNNSSGASTAVPNDSSERHTDADGSAGAATSLSQIPSSSRSLTEERNGVAIRPPHVIAGYDWSTFVTAYAAGRWNPHRTPSAPRAAPASRSVPGTPADIAERERLESIGGPVVIGSGVGGGGNLKGSMRMAPPSLRTSAASPDHAIAPRAESSSRSNTSNSDLSGSGSLRGGGPSSAPSSVYSDSLKDFTTPQPQREASLASSSGNRPSVVTESDPAGLPFVLEPQPASVPSTSPIAGLSLRRASLGSTYGQDGSGNTMRIPLPPLGQSSGSMNSPLIPSLQRTSLFSPSGETPSHLQNFPSSLPTPNDSTGQTIIHAMSAMPSGARTPELAAAAATMRWAASSHASLSPLALPSPERELTDPMRGATFSMSADTVEDTDEGGSSDQGARERLLGLGIRSPANPSSRARGERKTKFMKGRTPSQTRRIWEKFTSEKYQSSSEETEFGRGDDDDLPSEPRRSRRRDKLVDAPTVSASSTRLPTIEASPLGSPVEREKERSGGSSSSSRGSGDHGRSSSICQGHRSSSLPAPASAPLLRVASEEESKAGPLPPAIDYFGLAVRRDESGPRDVSPILEATSLENSPDQLHLPPKTQTQVSISDLSPDASLRSQTHAQSESMSSITSSTSFLSEASSQSLPPFLSDQSLSDPSIFVSPPPPFSGSGVSGIGSSTSVPNTPAIRASLNRHSSSPFPSRHSSEEEDIIITNEGSRSGSPVSSSQPKFYSPPHPLSQSQSHEDNLLSSPPSHHHSQDQGTPKKPAPVQHNATFDLDEIANAKLQKAITVESSLFKPGLRPGLVRAQSMKVVGSSSSGGRFAREEEEYARRGYLVPPFPRDEIERRRALYKFNVVHTSPDINFDRIAYLTKLVFSTKIVVVSLVTEDKEWFKMESGMGVPSVPRVSSFSAHAVLQKSDEPTVVLDTRRDWRFRQNPLVTGKPGVRFFAAAPLRTGDGYNVGALCIMDDQPHSDFTPRQRHTLKEFAAIVMREMELWRDKIQLKIRDRIQLSMEHFTRECLEIDNEDPSNTHGVLKASTMDRVYESAAKLVKKTLDVEGAVVMDVSHFDVLETTKSEGNISIVCHQGGNGDSIANGSSSQSGAPTGLESTSGTFAASLDGKEPHGGTITHHIPREEYSLFLDFFAKYPDGKIAEGVIPPCFRSILPRRIQHALIVPIFNIDKQPFALLCAYNTAYHSKPFLEGHELSYLRAIGVIVLSAVLKRRMILADKSKSLFISNISHELRTPLHGILAAAELLGDTDLDDAQSSFLRTVQACGTSLVETVNHVLDFTKLSGNQKSGGVENVIHPSKVDMMQLVEEAVEGCWIGFRARLPASSEIGTVYAPPTPGSQFAFGRASVETVIDIGFRSKGWHLVCEKGGLRRVLMNLIGNSLKFTSKGYVHITLREIPASDTPPGMIKVEMAVLDTGKGISKEFLKNHLFHPFSQENPLQTGTGLGLAIVNSIINSESVKGHVDVSSLEGIGTEIRITFNATVAEESNQAAEIEKLEMNGTPQSVSMVGFDDDSKGTTLLRDVLEEYLKTWCGLDIAPPSEGDPTGNIVLLNEDPSLLVKAIVARDISRPFVLLTSSRADAERTGIANDFERINGFCRIVYKPAGPNRLRQVLKGCVCFLLFRETSGTSTSTSAEDFLRPSATSTSFSHDLLPSQARRTTQAGSPTSVKIPRLSRANTYHPILPSKAIPGSTISTPPQEFPSSPGETTITIGASGTLLKSSIGTWNRQGQNRARILVVEDNQILRDLLTRWLSNKGYDYQCANDGREGVNAFEASENIDVVLVDLSMPVLDGIGATREMREIEAKRMLQHEQQYHQGLQNGAVASAEVPPPRSAKILALTGMSSLEDKRKAFEAGVDGYLVKPVAFKLLDTMFHQLGVS